MSPGYLIKLCALQAIVVAMMTWQLYTERERELRLDHKRMQFCIELARALPTINCENLE